MSLAIFNDEKKMQLMRDTICKGSSDDEFQLFAYTCKRLGLDPFARQIFPVKRWDSALRREVMSIQTGIDGYRLIADRTGRYAPGRDPEFNYDENGKLLIAKAFVKKQTPDGVWHEVAASAHFDEYVATKKDGTPTHMWDSKRHIMLAKCAEALALRKAFPAELSGVYTQEEMDQANNTSVPSKEEPVRPLSDVQIEEIQHLLMGDTDFEKTLLGRLNNAFGSKSWCEVPITQYENVMKVINDHNEDKLAVNSAEEEIDYDSIEDEDDQ